MKISVSNIAWHQSPEKINNFFRFLKDLGCDGVELAPSAIWEEPINSSKKSRDLLKKNIRNFNLAFIGFHSLLYSKPELRLFENSLLRRKTKIYLNNLIDLCSDLEGTKLIYGSPKSRQLCGRKYEDCKKQSIEDFYEIAEHSKKKGVIFCLEPLSIKETDFATSLEEGGEIVNEVNHDNFKLHLDTKAVFGLKKIIKTTIYKYKDLIKHVHVSDENLSEPGTINREHEEIGKSLREINYKGFVTLEMRRNLGDIKGSIERGVKFIKEKYLKS